MKHAIVVQCHRLTKALEYTVGKLVSRPDVFVVIHVDKKTPLEEFGHLKGPNVSLLPFRESVDWGAFTQIKATLNAFEYLRDKEIEFDYVSLISGDDVLLKSVEEFSEFLTENSGTEFIGVQKSEGSFLCPSDRVRYRYPSFFFTKKMTARRRILLIGFKIMIFLGFYRNETYKELPNLYKGSSWFTITHGAMDYILEFLENNKVYSAAFKNSFCADEVFFQTILMNSQFRNKINNINDCNIDDNFSSLRYIDWNTGPDYPRTLGTEDVKFAKGTSLFFARKVSDQVSLPSLKGILG